MKLKFGIENFSKTETEVSVLREFTKNLEISIPTDAKPKDILKLRNSHVGEELRKVLKKLVNNNQKGDISKIKTNLFDKYSYLLDELNNRANIFSNISSAIITGCISTVGGYFGGTTGAITGGIGASLVSLGTRNALKNLYKITHKNWAFYFYKWKSKSENKGKH